MEYKQRRDRRENLRKVRDYEKETESVVKAQELEEGTRDNRDRRQLEGDF